MTMTEKALGGAQLLRKSKPRLIDALSADIDLVLQHADSLSLVTQREYHEIKAQCQPSAKARDLLDCVLQKDNGPAEDLLKLLREPAMQEAFPKLSFLMKPSRHSSQDTDETAPSKRWCVEEDGQPTKRMRKAGSPMVTEKQLMLVAGVMGRSWKEGARLVLEIPSAKLDQFVEDHPNHLVEQVFAMLRYWRNRERREATAGQLHALLSQPVWALLPENIDFLLEES